MRVGAWFFMFVSFMVTTHAQASLTSYPNYHPERVKAVILDMDGVLRTGTQALPGASEIIHVLEDSNISGIILTNECRYTEKQIRQDLNQMNIYYPQNWPIYTAAHSMRDFIRYKIPNHQGKKHLYVIGETGLRQAIAELNSKYVTVHNQFPTKVEVVDDLYVIFGTVETIHIQDLEQASIWINRGAKVMTTCPDAADPAAKGEKLIGMPGHLIHMIRMNAPCRPYSVGKPNRWMLEQALLRLKKQQPNLKDDNILFIGDSMDTEMRVAFESNLQTALVLTGNTQRDSLKHFVIKPNFVAENLLEIKQSLEF